MFPHRVEPFVWSRADHAGKNRKMGFRSRGYGKNHAGARQIESDHARILSANAWEEGRREIRQSPHRPLMELDDDVILLPQRVI